MRDEDDEDESGYDILVVNYIAKDGGGVDAGQSQPGARWPPHSL